MPLVFPALERNIQNHWNQTVLNLTRNVKNIFREMDEELATSCQKKSEEENSRQSSAAEKRKVTWERLETAASLHPNGESMLSSVEPAMCSVAC